MESKDLRIGNWCMRLDNTYFQISGKDISQIDDFPIELRPKPIPLTEEWLLKFGFEKLPYSFSCEKYRISKQDKSDYWWTAFNANSATINKMKYVHELQNLHYSLTQTELIIKQ